MSENIRSKSHNVRNTRYARPEDKIRHLRDVERKKRRRDSIGVLIVILVVVIAFILIVLSLTKKAAEKPQFMVVPYGSIEHYVKTKTLILRDETVIIAPFDGIVSPQISSGSKVYANQQIGYIITSGSETAIQDIANYERQISEIMYDLVSEGKAEIARPAYDETDGNISSVAALIRRDLSAGNIRNLESYAFATKLYITKRDSRLANIEFDDSRLTQLMKNKNKLENALGSSRTAIIANKPGTVSFNVFSGSGTIKRNEYKNITVNGFRDFLNKYDLESSMTERVEKSGSCARIIEGIYQNFVFIVSSDYDEYFVEGSLHDITLNNGAVDISGCKTVKKLVQGDNLLITLESEYQLSALSDFRVTDINVKISEMSGLKIPMKSLINYDKKNNTAGIMFVENGYAKIYPVKILDFDGEYVIIESTDAKQSKKITAGFIIKNPDSVNEGDKINE